MKNYFIIIYSGLSLLLLTQCNPAPKAVFNEDEFRDKVYACWLGKNIGGTLGMPFEGKTEVQNVIFYTNVKEGEPAANDDLDLQLLWLKAMEENNAKIDACKLSEYWLKYVPVDWNEYGVGKRNMARGIMPPLSGEYENTKWKPSNGAWIRSEIWACLAPGCPELAAKFAREDACVDHGIAEGTFAEIFTATLESAAFVEHDRDKLIAFGLSMIPENCRVAKAVKVAVKAKQEGKDWKQAREDVIAETRDMGWFQAPGNVAFTMIGLLWGEGDFGKSICIAVNCGDDTDCTGATLGSILGIIGGTKSIPDKWKKPIGIGIVNVAISGFDAPKDIAVLTAKTIEMTRKVIKTYNLPVSFSANPTSISNPEKLLMVNSKEIEKLWHYTGYQIDKHDFESEIVVSLDYIKDPIILPGEERNINIILENESMVEKTIDLKIAGLNKGWNTKGMPSEKITLAKNSAKVFNVSLMSESPEESKIMKIIALVDGRNIELPFTLIPPQIAMPEISTVDTMIKNKRKMAVLMSCATPGINLLYAMNGSEPTEKSAKYEAPIILDKSSKIRVKALRKGMKSVQTRAIDLFFPGVNGLNYKYADGEFSTANDIDKFAGKSGGFSKDFDASTIKRRDDQFGICYKGYIKINTDGKYTFYITSDDGSILWIDGREIVNNDGGHAPQEKQGSVELKKGMHEIHLNYYDIWGGDELKVEYSCNNMSRRKIPVNALFIKK
jgi:ADP-ribosylglycohydrolase